MTYRPTPATKDWEAPPGIGPWREISDEEYARLAATYDGDLSRWYERSDHTASDTSEPRPPRARARKEE